MITTLLFVVPVYAQEQVLVPEGYCDWQQTSFAIASSLCGLAGDPARGRIIVIDQYAGNCLACHQLPIPEEEFHGTIGPPLIGVGGRYSKAELRMRVVDEQMLNPMTIMPGFYRNPMLSNRISDDYWGKTLLSAQQVEDVIAYLKTLE